MNEIKRVLFNRALILSFLLLTAVNLSVYVKEQKSSMPAGFKLYRQEQARLLAQLDPCDLDTALRYAEEWQQEQQSLSLIHISLAQTDPVLFFQTYQPPIIIDEVQKAPQLFEQIKIMCDASEETGRFWLAGSQQSVSYTHLADR